MVVDAVAQHAVAAGQGGLLETLLLERLQFLGERDTQKHTGAAVGKETPRAHAVKVLAQLSQPDFLGVVVGGKGVAQRGHRGEERVIVEYADPAGLGADVLDGGPQGDEVVLVDGEVGLAGDADEDDAVGGKGGLEGAEVVVGVIDNNGDKRRLAVREPVVKGGESLEKAVVVGGDAEEEVGKGLRGVGRRHGKDERVAGKRRNVFAVVEVDGGLFGQKGSVELGDAIAVDRGGDGGGDAAARVDDIVGEAELGTAQKVNVWAAGAWLERRAQGRTRRRRGRVVLCFLL